MNIIRSQYFIAISVVLALFLGSTGCGREGDDTEEEPTESPRVTLSDGENYLVQWSGPDAPLPFQELFELTLEIKDEVSSEPVNGLDLEIRVRVVDSTAEMPTKIAITPAAEGAYLVEGFLFHVPQAWNMVVTIDDGESIDHAHFEFEAVGRYMGELPEDPAGAFRRMICAIF